jgi:hypothetical protein
MLLNNRIIWSDNGVLKDLTIELNNPYSGSRVVDFVAAEDAIYIGSDLPFNHRYFEMSVVNAIDSAISIAIWTGSQWTPAVNVIDMTSLSDASLGQNGIISWTPDKDASSWNIQQDSSDIPALQGIHIYDLYWARLTFSVDLNPLTAISFVGHKFSQDEDLASFYPELNTTASKAMFMTGKTNWNPQHIAAAEQIIKDLRRKNIIWSRNQIINWELFTTASVHFVASIAFRAFGDDYQDNFAQAIKDYSVAMNQLKFEVDLNENGRVDEWERRMSVGILSR